ncbi:MAG: ATP-binding protein [Lachnospira sp.]|nr:ATP-binding protein [Lachnospira sp.]
MLFGRSKELKELEDQYSAAKNTITMLYGRKDIGKTSLIKEFLNGKTYIYYEAVLASEKEQYNLFYNTVNDKITTINDSGYGSLFEAILQMDKKVVLVIEEFQNIARYNKAFMNELVNTVSMDTNNQLTVILTSSSVNWIENNLVAAIGMNAMYISSFIKLKELNFVDTVKMFAKYDIMDAITVYAITGGVPGYLRNFSDKQSIKENICNSILNPCSNMSNAAYVFLKDELREISTYSTILKALAEGRYKLNDLYTYTEFGRDKISVYMKNLMGLELIEKMFSYDVNDKVNTKKGMYKIKTGYMEFYYKFIYPNQTDMNMLSAQEFYDKHIDSNMQEFISEAFIKVCTEYLELLASIRQLPLETVARKSRWWGKNGNIDIIFEGEDGKCLAGKCNCTEDAMKYSDYEDLVECMKLAKIEPEYIYLFSKGTFGARLQELAKSDKRVALISIDDF